MNFIEFKNLDNVVEKIFDSKNKTFLFRGSDLVKNIKGYTDNDFLNIVNNHDRKLTKIEIDNLVAKNIESWDSDYDTNYSKTFFIIQNEKIVGEVVISKFLKFKLLENQYWECSFCKKGDRSVVFNILVNQDKFNDWFKQNDLLTLIQDNESQNHSCSNCGELIDEYYILANEELVNFMESNVEKNYWILKMSNLFLYEDFKEFKYPDNTKILEFKGE